MVYRINDLGGFHNSSAMHWFLEFWWVRCFLKVLVVLGKIVVSVWFGVS